MKIIWVEIALSVSIAFFPRRANGQTSRPVDNAARLYLQAATLVQKNVEINVQCPAASNNTWPREYPPYAEDWQDMESFDFDSNSEARELAHRARAIDQAQWPALGEKFDGGSYLNACRGLANELSDAALYQMTQKDYGAAIETLRDEWHFADLLQKQSPKKLIILLVDIGIRALALDRLEIVMANAVFTKDLHDLRDAQITVARELVGQLLQQEDAVAQVAEYLKAEGMTANRINKPTIARLIQTSQKIDAEREMSAMAIACELYRFDHKKWPASPDELHGYLPNIPIDPGGDGTQTLGYALIKKGLPNGSDRPLVYSRLSSHDGLFFRTDQPYYTYYNRHGSSTDLVDQKQGGEFRDVTAWVPAEGSRRVPTTQLLN